MQTVIITASGGFGDIACSTCLLTYRDQLWPGKHLIWIVHPHCEDILKFNDKIDEVRIGANVSSDFDLSQALIVNTAPWSNPNLVYQGVPYCYIPMKVVKQTFNEWHPYIVFTREEEETANSFVNSFPYPKTIMLETYCRSGQSSWTTEDTIMCMETCRNILGPCNFLFASKSGFNGSPKQIIGDENDGVFDLSNFTIRQCIPIFNLCNMMIGISSGLSCSFCAWQASPKVERVEYVYKTNMGTWPMARGPIKTVTDKNALHQEILRAATRIKYRHLY